MFRFIIQLCAFLPCLLAAHETFKYQVFHGAEIAPHVKDITTLCNTVYREYPYLYDGTSADYDYYLANYAKNPAAVVVMAYEGHKPVGLATGIPMKDNRDHYKKPFADKGENLDSIYYLGELVVLPEYRKHGIGKKLVKTIELSAKANPAFKTIAIAQIDEATVKDQKPANFVCVDDFWKKHGFVRHPELAFTAQWKNVGSAEETPHAMFFWTKAL